MSKFLKFIVHFIVICTIVCVVGLAVPPFLGITTEIMDDSGKETNLPMGSVTYAIPVKIKEAVVGDSILYQTDSKAYRYMITEMDKKNHIFKVIDSSDKDAEPVAVEVKDYIPKVVITVGYAGYLLLATESIEGLIILGLAVLFLVILYIVAELLKKEPQDDIQREYQNFFDEVIGANLKLLQNYCRDEDDMFWKDIEENGRTILLME